MRNPIIPAPGIRSFHHGILEVHESVDYQGERYGTMVLVVSTDGLRARIRERLVLMLTFMAGLIAVSIFLGVALGRLISRPILNLAAVAHDISQRHDYTLRVPKTSRDEIGVLSDSLNDMLAQIERRQHERDEADQRTREKSLFLANMSHELRTPLNAIIGFSEILQERLHDRMEEREQRFLENIHSSGEHLLGIVNDVLDLSKVEAGRMEVHPEALQLGPSIEGVCHLMKGLTTRRKIHFEVEIQEGLPTLYADPVKIKQVLYNLLSNAVKFSPENSVVTIRARRLPAAESPLAVDSFQIEVCDQGIGIDPVNHQMIFREFQQVDASFSRQFEGTGLGLALVKKFVEIHDGKVEVESALGSGSTFRVVIPQSFRGQQRPALIDRPSSLENRVLVIEDEPSAFLILERALSSGGYTAVWARSGEEGVDVARAIRPSAITLDIILPGMDGWKVLKALKAHAETARIPIIIISLVDNRELGFAFGADDYLTKPIHHDRLLEALQQVIGKRAAGTQKLLLVDPDRNLHDLLEEHLAGRGYDIVHAYTVEEGRAGMEEPALVIIDLMMQQLRGLDFALELRNDVRTAQLPILALASEELTAADALRLGGKMSAIIDKSRLSTTQLSNVIDSLVQRRVVPETV